MNGRRAFLLSMGGLIIGASALVSRTGEGGPLAGHTEGVEPDAIEVVADGVRTYEYKGDDIDAVGWVRLHNSGTQKYHVVVELGIFDAEGGRIGPTHNESAWIEAGQTIQLKSKWNHRSNREKHADHTEIVSGYYEETEALGGVIGGEEVSLV